MVLEVNCINKLKGGCVGGEKTKSLHKRSYIELASGIKWGPTRLRVGSCVVFDLHKRFG